MEHEQPNPNLNAIQSRILGWLYSLSLGDPNKKYQYEKLFEETQEVFMAYMENAPEDEIMGEVADVMFVCTGILALHGYSAEQMLAETIERNKGKYNAEAYNMYRACGKTHEEAMQAMKDMYNSRNEMN